VFQDGTTAFREVAWKAVTLQKLTIVTAREQDDLRNKNERQGLMAELQHIMRKKLDELKAAQAEQQSQALSRNRSSPVKACSGNGSPVLRKSMGLGLKIALSYIDITISPHADSLACPPH
jgi:hypothetical protein